MNKHIAIAAGLILGTSLLGSAAHAHGRVHWSVTIGSPGYVYTQPGVVVYPQTQYQTQYIYGAPPSVYSPPPVIYVQPQPIQVVPPARLRVEPYGHYPQWKHEWHERRHGWHHQHHHWDRGHHGHWDHGNRWDHRR